MPVGYTEHQGIHRGLHGVGEALARALPAGMFLLRLGGWRSEGSPAHCRPLPRSERADRPNEPVISAAQTKTDEPRVVDASAWLAAPR